MTTGDLWLDDLTINGEKQDFSRDPKWKGLRNRKTYETRGVRPWFDFGYSPTNYAGGAAKGELGGIATVVIAAILSAWPAMATD